MFGGKKKRARDEIFRIRREARGRLGPAEWHSDLEHTAYAAAAAAIDGDFLEATAGGTLSVDPLAPEDRGLLMLVSRHLCPNRPPLGCATDSYIWSEAESWEDFDDRELSRMLAVACEEAGPEMNDPRSRFGGSYFGVLGQHEWADGIAAIASFRAPWEYVTSRSAWERLAFLADRAWSIYPLQLMVELQLVSEDPAMRLQYEVTSAAGVLAERFMAMKRSGVWS